jgi:anti-anti-sigma factor
MAQQNVPVRERNGWLWLDFPETLNAHTARILEQDLGEALGVCARIVVDMAKVRFLYSTAIGFLIRLHKRIGASQGRLCLVNVVPAVRAIFVSINLDKVFALYATDTEFEVSTEFWESGAMVGAPPFVAIPQLEGDICRVVLCGYMTQTNTRELLASAQIDAAVRGCLFDISGLQTVECAVLDSLVDFLRQLHHRGIRAAVFGAGEAVAPLCALIALEEALPVFESEQQALQALRSGLLT